MEPGEYERLAAVEERLWWFRGLHAHLVAALAGAGAPRAILDAGCGTGGLMARLASAFPGTAITGLDIDRGAAALARRKSARPVAVGSVDCLPFPDAAFDAILSADVLCHRGVEEARALRDFHRCLASGGRLVLNLPAYPWLHSEHDRAVANVRRYDRAALLRRLAEAGFVRSRARYWNGFLFPVMLVRRKLWRRGGPRPESDVALLPAPVERAFGAVMALERGLLGAGLPLPFGGSILAIAVKP